MQTDPDRPVQLSLELNKALYFAIAIAIASPPPISITAFEGRSPLAAHSGIRQGSATTQNAVVACQNTPE
jgi:hypothetical protein